MTTLPFAAPPDVEPPVLGGKYRLVRQLGSGGMGAVWVARNAATGAEVALKVLLQGDCSGELVERLRREAHATASLSHRSIVRIYDLIELGDGGGQVAIVMELLHGRTLGDHLFERETLPVEEAVGIALPLLSALSHAHAHGVVHRDLKPENVFLSVDPDGTVTPKILDFGISKLRVPGKRIITQQGELLGTPSYMSPEQARGLPGVDGRSDLFNVGILLYEMLSGRNPFVGEGLHGTMVCLLEEEPPRIADLSTPLWRVITRALAKSPDKRFANAGEFAAALRSAVGLPEASSPSHASATDVFAAEASYTPGPQVPAPMFTEPPKVRRRSWKLFAAAAGASLAAAAVAGTLALWTTGAVAGPAAATTLEHAAVVSTPVVVHEEHATLALPASDLAQTYEAHDAPTRAAVSAHVRPAPAGASAPAAMVPAAVRAPSSSHFARDPGF